MIVDFQVYENDRLAGNIHRLIECYLRLDYATRELRDVAVGYAA